MNARNLILSAVAAIASVAAFANTDGARSEKVAVVATDAGTVRISSLSHGCIRVTRGEPVSPELVFAPGRGESVAEFEFLIADGARFEIGVELGEIFLVHLKYSVV